MTVQRLLITLHRLLRDGLLDPESEVQVSLYECKWPVGYVGAGTVSKCAVMHAEERAKQEGGD